ncbi:MAG TPA: bifunctional diaminohydroxyphosphoribosylaminopyrimidine deaminase/5-amino-6-(5-phosphoribosylamino)uracil reductase RibD [Bryobacteraceae bacterium]|jgi:diaminohydroxyphosphoribosylaminopyrimidine deaminase/5-amino-6-(5-phosphoribosylamino)uracil reductase
MSSDHMREALTLAKRGVALATPNPMVGAVVVRGEEIVGRGFHTWQNIKHAEVLALEEAGEAARGATVYVTLEPCSHYGRTGPCADALIAAGVSKVVAPSLDPNPLVAGEGFRRLRAAGIQAEVETEFQAEAEKLNEPFFHFMRTGRCLVTLKSASTLDGKIAAPEDNTGWITSDRARAHVQDLRHASDAIITGIGTALADDPKLTDRSGLPRARPLLRVVLDSTLRLPLESQLVQTAAGDLIVAATSAASAERRRALENRGVEVKMFDGPRGRVDIRDVVALLSERKCLSVMIEAGSKVNWAALESGVTDKVFLYYAPKILGGLQSLPLAGGTGRMRRADAILLERTTLHPIPPDEFAVEAYVRKDV